MLTVRRGGRPIVMPTVRREKIWDELISPDQEMPAVVSEPLKVELGDLVQISVVERSTASLLRRFQLAAVAGTGVSDDKLVLRPVLSRCLQVIAACLIVSLLACEEEIWGWWRGVCDLDDFGSDVVFVQELVDLVPQLAWQAPEMALCCRHVVGCQWQCSCC